MKIVQYTPTLIRGDAVSSDCLAIDKVLKAAGYDSKIYIANEAAKTPKGVAKVVSDFSGLKSEDVLIFHMSIHTGLDDKLRACKAKKIMIYHNITPPAFFSFYNYGLKKACYLGLEEVRKFADIFSYVIADSEFNKQNLIDMGYKCPIDVIPLVIPLDDYKQEPDKDFVEKYSDDFVNILFVGRLAPNKKQENIIAAFDCYKKSFNPKSRLILVGSDVGTEKYSNRLKNFVEELGTEDVIFPGHISFAAILAFYSTADVFVCLSEHEGFCVPLVEAMCFDLPVIAYDACAVPYTLDGSGLLIKNNSPEYVAAAIDTLMNDKKLRDNIVSTEKKRLEDFEYEKIAPIFKEKLEKFIKG